MQSYDCDLQSFAHLPSFLTKSKYANPGNPRGTVMLAAKGFPPGDAMFDYYLIRDTERHAFENMMGGVMKHRTSWLNVFEAHDELVCDAKSDEAVLLDVGGSVGYDIQAFRVVHPDVADKLVLQDRRELLENSVCGKDVQTMVHDSFTPQPVRGEPSQSQF